MDDIGEASSIRDSVACLGDEVYSREVTSMNFGKLYDHLKRLRTNIEFGIELRQTPNTGMVWTLRLTDANDASTWRGWIQSFLGNG